MIRVVHESGIKDPVVFSTYPDGTFYTKWRPVMVDSYGPITAIEFVGTTVDELTRALFLADALEERGERVPEFIIPFIPGGRQDRLNEEGDFLFTAQSVADLINLYGFDRVTTSDPHSEFTVRTIKNLWIDTLVDFKVLFGGRYNAVIAPDKGAEDRATKVATALGVPVFFAGKTRDVETGALTGFTFPEDIKTGRYLVVDDICDGGGTFLGLAAVAPEAIQLDLYVTHGLFTRGSVPLTRAFGKVYSRFCYGARQPQVIYLDRKESNR